MGSVVSIDSAEAVAADDDTASSSGAVRLAHDTHSKPPEDTRHCTGHSRTRCESGRSSDLQIRSADRQAWGAYLDTGAGV